MVNNRKRARPVSRKTSRAPSDTPGEPTAKHEVIQQAPARPQRNLRLTVKGAVVAQNPELVMSSDTEDGVDNGEEVEKAITNLLGSDSEEDLPRPEKKTSRGGKRAPKSRKSKKDAEDVNYSEDSNVDGSQSESISSEEAEGMMNHLL
jgi:hypothetical protein